MSILDIGIVVFLILGAVIGFKRGFTKSLVNFVGYILIIIIAYILKNPLSEFLMLHLPFFDFYGVIKGISVLNIAIYEVIAFAIVFLLLLIILKILLLLTGIFEKILSMTIVLGIPSKLLGMLIGIIQNYTLVFIILFIMSLPNFSDISWINDSKLKDTILYNTPVLTNISKDSLEVFNEFSQLKEKYKTTSSSNKFNLETLDLFLKYGIVKVDLVEKLIDNDKIHIKNVDKIIIKYKEE